MANTEFIFIKVTTHVIDRFTNQKLSKDDIILFSRRVVLDFELYDKQNGFYKFIYDNIHIVLKKEKKDDRTRYVVITLFEKYDSYIMLNQNFQIVKGFFQGHMKVDREKVPISISTIDKRVHNCKNKKFKTPHNANTRQSSILKSMDSTIRAMYKTGGFIISTFQFNSSVHTEKFQGIFLKDVKYIIVPKIQTGFSFFYLMSYKQKLLRTVHINDYDKFKFNSK